MEGMTEEQKEYEAMQLVNKLDKLQRSVNVQACADILPLTCLFVKVFALHAYNAVCFTSSVHLFTECNHKRNKGRLINGDVSGQYPMK